MLYDISPSLSLTYLAQYDSVYPPMFNSSFSIRFQEWRSCPIDVFFILLRLKCIWFTMSYEFQLYNTVTQQVLCFYTPFKVTTAEIKYSRHKIMAVFASTLQYARKVMRLRHSRLSLSIPDSPNHLLSYPSPLVIMSLSCIPELPSLLYMPSFVVFFRSHRLVITWYYLSFSDFFHQT